MIKKEFISICSLYSISPVHAGSGTSTSAVDLPIQREKHTNWPHIQASGVKGSMRDLFRRAFSGTANLHKQINYIFGFDEQDRPDKKDESQPGQISVSDESQPGQISVSDAKLFAFPVRSNVSPFISVTSPAVIKRLQNDLLFAGIDSFEEIKISETEKAICIEGNVNGKIILEDIVIDCNKKKDIPIINTMFPEIDNLIVVSDTVFDHIVSTCTEIQTQIKINKDNGTAVDGALRYEELLPSDTSMYAIVYSEEEVIDKTFKSTIKDFIQIGGDYTLGRGIFRINWYEDKGGE